MGFFLTPPKLNGGVVFFILMVALLSLLAFYPAGEERKRYLSKTKNSPLHRIAQNLKRGPLSIICHITSVKWLAKNLIMLLFLNIATVYFSTAIVCIATTSQTASFLVKARIGKKLRGKRGPYKKAGNQWFRPILVPI